MAAGNSILKLKVESEEYDAKLKRAAEGIRHLADVAHKSGGELTGLEKSELEYIRALGSMETKSKTAAGATRELENAFKELTVIYNNLNDMEKADEGGKALAASLETLKQRAQDARAQMDAASQSLQTNASAGQEDSSALSMLADKFTINIDAIKLFNIGLQAAEGALSVAKDAFFASEATVDEWGRIMQSSQSLYEGFLNAINNSDISGYLSRMDEIVQAARAAYNEIDTLGTMKTIQAPKMSAQQTENERLRMMIQTGRYIAPIDGRKASMQDGQLLTPAQIKTLERQLQNGMKSVVKLVGNEVKQTGKAIDAYYNSIAKQNGMSLQEFKKGTSSWEEFSKKMQGYQQYQKWRQENSFTDMYGNRQVREGNPYQEFKKWGTFRVDKMGDNSYNDLVRLIQQRDQQAAQAYGMQSQAYRTMNRAEGVTVRKIMGDTGGASGKGGNTDKNLDAEQQVQQKINDLLKEALIADANRQGEIRQQVAELQKQQEKYKDIKNLALGILPKDKEAVFTIDGQLSEETKKNLREIQGVTIDDKTMTVTAETADALRALQGIEGVTIDPKTVTITATDEALPKLRDIQGITIDDKTMTVTAETADALRALQGIEGVTIAPKSVTITATDEALPKLREIEGVTIDDKTMTVTAETADALRALQGIEGVTIAPKTVTITATDEALPKLRDIQGVTIDDKTMTVTADTQEAMQKVQELIGQVSTITLQMKVAPPDLDKIFPDMSKENYNTGYQGSAQAKYDSARADIALGPMNFDAVNTYIGSVKGMLKDANLGDELYTSMTEKLKDATTVSTLLQEMMERGLAGADLESTAQALKEKMLSPEGIDQTAIQSFLEGLNKQIEEAGGVGLKLNTVTGEVTDDKGNDDGEDLKKFNEGIGKLSGGLSQLTGGLKAVGIEIPKEVDEVIGVVNGISQIISGVGTIISIFGTTAITANTTAVGLNTAAIAGLIAAIEVNTATNFIPFLANGGIVPAFAHGGLIGRAAGGLMIPGNSMSGDRLRLPVDGGHGMIGVNSGELILNRAQQGNLASQLEGGVAAAANTQPFINGEQIYLGLQAYMRRSGLGEIVTAER